ncbi:MAG: DUF3853 family protein [Bacteroides sp.]|nr:DUF3853 family protein [Bacteroides sp.]MCM1403805.1 DUF3853 family protein [Bacteroides sp.]MCM1443543.1 DUF3853 family protein [Muribaculum sp.]MCM1577122.1 DUF3853 family protein [Bacteroides sp.]
MTKDLNSRLIDVTVGEVFELAKPLLKELLAQVVIDNLKGNCADEFGHGLKAIQEVFGCSTTKAVDIHYDKRFSPAFFDEGRKIVVNKTLLRKLMQDEKLKRINCEKRI